MPISMVVEPLAGVLKGFRRGGRDDDDGAVAFPEAIHSGRNGDDVMAAVLGACSGASSAWMSSR